MTMRGMKLQELPYFATHFSTLYDASDHAIYVSLAGDRDTGAVIWKYCLINECITERYLYPEYSCTNDHHMMMDKENRIIYLVGGDCDVSVSLI